MCRETYGPILTCRNRLDFNLHQLILTELAQNISDSIEAGDPKEEVNEAIEIITSGVVTRDVSDAQANGIEAMPKVFMVRHDVVVWLVWVNVLTLFSGSRLLGSTVTLRLDSLR